MLPPKVSIDWLMLSVVKMGAQQCHSAWRKYIKAFGNLAKESNTILLPSNSGDISSMVTQAMTIYQSLSSNDVRKQVHAAEQSELGTDDFIPEPYPAPEGLKPSE